MFSESDLLPISALQHVVYCERQAALIHVERLWSENVHTVEGRHLHDAVDERTSESRRERRIARSLPIRTFQYGLAGVADVVEFHHCDDGAELWNASGRWRPFPVEYKKGKPKRHRADHVQLCAQALCLEEMFSARVESGALFYGTPRRRTDVIFDAELRNVTLRAATRFREIVEKQLTPPAVFGAKCRECSLFELCRPRAAEKSATRYLAAHYGEAT